MYQTVLMIQINNVKSYLPMQQVIMQQVFVMQRMAVLQQVVVMQQQQQQPVPQTGLHT